jgi:uncharacterized membrane protein YecN with MAPEG domain
MEDHMLVATTALYAGLLAILIQYLGGSVGATRGRLKIPLGDGGNSELIVKNRRHMNAVENVPLALLLLALVELNGTPKLWIHIMGASLLVARAVHPWGLKIDSINEPARIFGAAVTALVTVAAAAILIWQGVTALM